MNKMISMVVEGTCEKCPYCHVDMEVGEAYCSNQKIVGNCCITFDGVFPGILENCPLPNAKVKK